MSTRISLLKITLSVCLVIAGMFGFASHAFAGTLTNFSYSATTYTPSATADYTFNYTLENANPNMIAYINWANGFDLSGSNASVTINGTPVTVNEYWNGGGGGNTYIRLTDPTAASGAQIVVTYSNVVNPSSAGSYTFGFIQTADSGGNTIDAPVTIDAVVITGPDVPFTGAGSGTDMDPYVITTCAQLQEMKNHLNATYSLGNDIDCSVTESWNSTDTEWVDGVVGGTLIPDPYTIVENNGYRGFEPVGDNTNPFTGKLNGYGHAINNLWIFRKTTSFVGLFGFINGATIQNTTLYNARIVGYTNTGGFAGYMQSGTISGVTNSTGSVRAYLAYYGGGIVGYMEDGSITSADVIDGAVHGSGNVIGGIVGRMSGGTISDSFASADIDGGEYIGGFVGYMSGGSIDESVATGDVISNSTENNYQYIVKSGQFSGGFVGRMEGGVITNAHATGSVTAESSYAGGFAGTMESVSGIHDVYATGAVTGSALVGGFVGAINDSEIQDAYATGTVTSVGDNVGGFAGQSSCGSVFTRVYATGNVTGGNNTGGFSGADGCEGPGSTFIQSYAAGNVNGGMSVGGFLGQTYDSTVTDAYASGNVEGAMKTGGFAGEVFGGTYTNAYSRGHVQAGMSFNGFIGETPYVEWLPAVTNSFYDNDTASAGSSNGGTGKTTIEMKTTTTFIDAGWDFDTIWTRNSSNNNGYPYFSWQTFDNNDSTPPVLTVINAIPSRVKLKDAVLVFRTNEACSILAEQPTSTKGPVELQFTEPSPDIDIEGTLVGMKVGGTYSFRFECRDESNNASNIVEVGPFKIVEGSVSGGSAGSSTPVTYNDGGSQSSKDTCPTDQILTQNVKAGARNGNYHPYTKAIVTEVKILQAHMNRLGFNAGVVDGILGPITDGAIKRMQTFLKTKPDGYVGPITRGLINKSCGAEGLKSN